METPFAVVATATVRVYADSEASAIRPSKLMSVTNPSHGPSLRYTWYALKSISGTFDHSILKALPPSSGRSYASVMTTGVSLRTQS